jgi:hypothetical protein
MPAGQASVGQRSDDPQVRSHRRPGRARRSWGVWVVAIAVLAGAAAVAAIAPRLAADLDPGSAGARGIDRGPAPVAPADRVFPDGASTGVPDGVELTPSGGITVRDDGAVIENLLVVDGAIEVYANNVTIRNVRVTNERRMLYWGIAQRGGYSGLTVENSEIFGNPDSSEKVSAGISNHGGMITVRFVEIHTVTDGIMTSHGLIEGCYLHSPRYFEGDHTDLIQAVGGSGEGLPLEIRGNTLINTEDQTGAVFLSDELGTGERVPVQNVLVENNLLAGGGYTLYGGGLVADGRDPRDIVIRDNVFSRQVWPNGGYWGPVSYFDPGAPGNEWSGNVWDDGSPVEPG